jgi:ribosomal protein S18 acetylase RimI-like enzyme
LAHFPCICGNPNVFDKKDFKLDFTLTALTPSDFESFYTISVFEDQTQFVSPTANVLSRFSGKSAETYVFIAGAKNDGQAAGIIVVTSFYETAELNDKKLNICWIDTLAIDKKYQRQGVGSKLLNYAVSALDGNFDCMCLTVNVRNKSAQYMYSKCGFRDIGEMYYGGMSGPQNILEYDFPNI